MDVRQEAAAQRSSYVESILRHSLIAELGSELWRRNPSTTLQVFNSDVDDAGFDLVLKVRSAIRYVQLKQSHDGKMPPHCSVRLSFSELAGSCIILMSYSMQNISISSYSFLGEPPELPMKPVADHNESKSPVKKNKDGKKKIRKHYRDVPIGLFKKRLPISDLVECLFPAIALFPTSGIDTLDSLKATWPSNGQTADEYVRRLREGWD